MGDAEHIDAVARVLAYPEQVRDRHREQAHALLTADDHLAHAAMLDALVRAGVLRESWMHRNASGGGSIHETRDLAESEQAEYLHRHWDRRLFQRPMPESEGIFRRLVTKWEAQP